MKNWYTPPDLGQGSLSQGRIACQRENIWWDAELRRAYALRVNIVTMLLFILLLVWGIVSDWSLRELLSGPMAFSLSVLFIGLKHGLDHLKAANRLDKLRSFTNLYGKRQPMTKQMKLT